MKLLEAAEAGGREADSGGLLPVHVAAAAGQATLTTFLAARVGVDMVDKQGMTPIMWAAYRSTRLKTL